MKYRVWWHNQYLKPDSCYLRMDGHIHAFFYSDRDNNDPEMQKTFEVEFSSGFKDKNGVEIFEGDMLDGFENPVTFENGCFFANIEYDLQRFPLIELDFNHVEVIGHKHKDKMRKIG